MRDFVNQNNISNDISEYMQARLMTELSAKKPGIEPNPDAQLKEIDNGMFEGLDDESSSCYFWLLFVNSCALNFMHTASLNNNSYQKKKQNYRQAQPAVQIK